MIIFNLNTKKCIFLGIILSVFLSNAFAQTTSASLNRIVYQVQVRQWVSSQDAKAIVSVNWVSNRQNVTQLCQGVMQNLQRIVPGVWHITQFSRIQMNAGVQKVVVQAEIRAPIKKLDAIYQRARKVSRPGQTYRVQSLDFNVNLEDIMQVKSALRQKVYKKVAAELKRLSHWYPKQHYFVHQITFTNHPIFSGTRLMQMTGNTGNRLAAVPASNPLASGLSNSQQVDMTAIVVLSAKVPA